MSGGLPPPSPLLFPVMFSECIEKSETEGTNVYRILFFILFFPPPAPLGCRSSFTPQSVTAPAFQTYVRFSSDSPSSCTGRVPTVKKALRTCSVSCSEIDCSICSVLLSLILPHNNLKYSFCHILKSGWIELKKKLGSEDFRDLFIPVNAKLTSCCP